jgi:hypothetical protein
VAGGLALAATLALVPHAARAQEVAAQTASPAELPPPATPVPSPPSTRWELAAMGGYLTAPIPGALTPLGGGVGGRFGVALPSLYLGAASTYYFGGSDGGATESTVLFGGEVGYGIHLAPELVLRPVVGLGGALISHSEPLTASSSTTSTTGRRGGRVDVVSSASGGNSNTTRITSFYVKPGIVLVYDVSSAIFLGAGADVLVVPKVTYADGSIASWVAYGANAQVGTRF